MLGYRLNVKWQYLIALMSCIVGAHAALVALIVVWSRGVVVLDDSNLVVARLLRPLVIGLGRGGSLMDARDVAKVTQEEHVGRKDGAGGVTYEVANVPTGEETIELSWSDSGPRRERSQKRARLGFLEGQYL